MMIWNLNMRLMIGWMTLYRCPLCEANLNAVHEYQQYTVYECTKCPYAVTFATRKDIVRPVIVKDPKL